MKNKIDEYERCKNIRFPEGETEYEKKREILDNFFQEMETYSDEQMEIVNKTASCLKVIDEIGYPSSCSEWTLYQCLIAEFSYTIPMSPSFGPLRYFFDTALDKQYLYMESNKECKMISAGGNIAGLILSGTFLVTTVEEYYAIYKKTLQKLCPIANVDCLIEDEYRS